MTNARRVLIVQKHEALTVPVTLAEYWQRLIDSFCQPV
jgi:hypothetical protein